MQRNFKFQVELPHHRHFLMTREVRCNLWLSGPDIRRSLLLSVVPDYCQLDFIHLPHPSLSFSHSKTHLSNFYRAMNSAPATEESCRVFVKMRRAAGVAKSRKINLERATGNFIWSQIDWRQFIFFSSLLPRRKFSLYFDTYIKTNSMLSETHSEKKSSTSFDTRTTTQWH